MPARSKLLKDALLAAAAVLPPPSRRPRRPVPDQRATSPPQQWELEAIRLGKQYTIWLISSVTGCWTETVTESSTHV